MSQNTPTFVLGDENRLIQISSTLISNALKFTRESGNITVFVKIFGKTTYNDLDEPIKKSYCRIKVKDTGCGVSDFLKDKLFTVFGN